MLAFHLLKTLTIWVIYVFCSNRALGYRYCYYLLLFRSDNLLETDSVSHSYLLYTCRAILVILFRSFSIIFLTRCRNCNLHKWGCVLVSATNSNRYVILCIYLIFVEVYWNFYIWSAYISLNVLFQSNFNLYRHHEQTNTFVVFLTQVIEIFFFIAELYWNVSKLLSYDIEV